MASRERGGHENTVATVRLLRGTARLAASAASRQSPRVMADSRSEKLAAFTVWAGAHITGDEKGQAQIFLDRLFQAFGHAGSLDVGGEAECRIRKAGEDGGGTSFADFVWKPVGTVALPEHRPAFHPANPRLPFRRESRAAASLFGIGPIPACLRQRFDPVNCGLLGQHERHLLRVIEP